MDPYTERLVERTRQRREMLNQKLGKTPDPAPRKRVLEDTANLQPRQPLPDDDSPKRQCLWESDGKGKPDTPAITGVKSRLQSLSSQRMHWEDTAKADEEMKPSNLTYDETDASVPVTQSSRKSRFAQLAQHINDFEDDLSHPTIQKVEEKKPRWQPPRPGKENELVQKTVSDAKDRHVSSPKKEYESYQGPVRSPGPKSNHVADPQPSPKKHHAPEPPPTPPMPQSHLTSLYGPPKPPRAISPVRAPSPKRSPAPPAPSGSPKVSTYKVELQTPNRPQSPKFQHQVKQVVNMTPINARSAETAEKNQEPTAKPVTERLVSWQKAVEIPQKPKVTDPTDLPLSERFAGWEQRVSQTPTTDTVKSCKVQPTPKLMCTTPGVAHETAKSTESTDKEGDPASKSVSDRLSQWKQQEASVNPRREQEPTAYPVSDRMSAWEHMSSANKVSYIKKVDPSCSPRLSPTRPPPPPVVPKTTGTPSKFAGLKPAVTPNKGLTPQKSFKECIEERASQMGRRPPPSGEGLPPKPPTSNQPTASNQSPSKISITTTKSQSPAKVDKSSPSRPPSSPVRVGSATKTLQQRLIEQTQHSKTDQLAEKLRQERMAEVNALHNRYHNGILKEDLQWSEAEVTSVEDGSQPPASAPPKLSAQDKREAIKAKAREDFNKKLAAMGFEISDSAATYSFQQNNQSQAMKKDEKENAANQTSETSSGEEATQKNGPGQASSSTKQSSSIYRLVSKKASEAEKPVVQKHTSSTSLKKVTFEGLNTSTESEVSTGVGGTETADDTYDAMDHDQQQEDIQSETRESFDDSYGSADDSSIPESYKGSSGKQDSPVQRPKMPSDDDDVSMSAFVPDSVRRESLLPHHAYNDNTSLTSEDSFDYNHKTDYRPLSPVAMAPSSVQSSSGSEYQSRQGRMTYSDQSSDESDGGEYKGEIDDLLDEAMDEVPEVQMRPKKEPVAAPRKRQSHMYATTAGELPIRDRCKSDGLAYSVSMYRTDKLSGDHEHVPKQKIMRNSHYTQQQVYEEDIQMPTQLPPEVQRQTIKDRIKELQELVSQEQSVIMQTSNALNQCCSGDSKFAGSVEQVECNRLLLVACQKRQAYLTEVQRLKETGKLDPPGQEGPKGSLTITDIRLPLKKEFVTKIGTASDNTVHYFIILIRNGPHVIFTQMLSTHDKNMRGSLDFPNLIKIHGISGNFSLVLEIYSMSVSRESLGKEKKKKTPKKPLKGFGIALESPGGPSAARTTSFTLITTLPITMKCLDKNCFSLERIPFLSPLHGMIYMRLKCMMEQNVEERGFLTMFEDVSGLGAWHRRWCVLTGNKLAFWKYPDDETRKDPIGFVDLKRCITEKVGLVPRDICARPHTFEMVAVRPPRKGEQDTLVTKTYSTMTTTRYQMSADTKEERIVWCNKINRALANIRTWHADAMRPVKPK